MPLWRGGPNTRILPTVLLTSPASKAADMAHLCVPQNRALGVCRGFVPDIQVCGTDGREDLINATITSNAEEEEDFNIYSLKLLPLTLYQYNIHQKRITINVHKNSLQLQFPRLREKNLCLPKRLVTSLQTSMRTGSMVTLKTTYLTGRDDTRTQNDISPATSSSSH